MRLKITSNLRPIINYDVLPIAGDPAPIELTNRDLEILRQLTYPYLVSGYAAYHPTGAVWYDELTPAERDSFTEESEILINKLIGDPTMPYLTVAAHTAIGSSAPHHAAATLDTDAAKLIDVSAAQVLGLDVQAINTVLAGPAAGAANEPTFRALVTADLPAHTHSKLVPDDGAPDPALSVDASGNAAAVGTLAIAKYLMFGSTSGYGGPLSGIGQATAEEFATIANDAEVNMLPRWFTGLAIISAYYGSDSAVCVLACSYNHIPQYISGYGAWGSKDTPNSINVYNVTTYHKLQNKMGGTLNDVVVIGFGRVKSGN